VGEVTAGKVEEPALQTELRTVLTTAINDLPADYRTAFLMHDVEGLSNPEIAETLHLSLPAVKSRVHRSRLFVRKKLTDYLKDAALVFPPQTRPHLGGVHLHDLLVLADMLELGAESAAWHVSIGQSAARLGIDRLIAFAHQSMAELMRNNQRPHRANRIAEQRMGPVEGIDEAAAVGRTRPSRAPGQTGRARPATIVGRSSGARCGSKFIMQVCMVRP
jgi:hypothetical protein